MGTMSIVVDVGEGHALDVARTPDGDYTAAVADGGAELVLRGTPGQILASLLGLAERVAATELHHEIAHQLQVKGRVALPELETPDLHVCPDGGAFVQWKGYGQAGLSLDARTGMTLSVNDSDGNADVSAHPLVMRLALLTVLGVVVREQAAAAPPEELPLPEIYERTIKAIFPEVRNGD